ncbi:MAG: hypothetical protein K9G60_04300 [Pseudolabrys sp.]|nr:hypothetical protein [Pseudolabrys sp.]
MPTAGHRRRTNLMLRGGAVAALFVLAAAGWWRLAREPMPASPPERTFPQAALDYFAGMDDGLALTPAQVRGRDTWLMWTGGNQAFWDYLARRSFGAFDLLKVLDSRGRGTRFATYGLMNEPGFKPAQAPDAYGLWLDEPDGSRDSAYAADYREAFPKDDFLRAYGRASGIVGLRLFRNPDFDDAARRRWDAKRFYDDPDYYRDKSLVRPYRVGMACGFCHVGPHPLHPPDDPEHPGWRNLSSNIGAQYLKPARVFVLPEQQDNFLFQVVNSMAPGTVDTSALATDNINNPRNMNAIYRTGTRLTIGAEEMLSRDNLALPGTQPTMKVPHVLKDGADSVGILGALARVYISIGSDYQEWTKHFNLLVGGKKQSPYPVGKAKKNSATVRATFDRLPDLADFFVAVGSPHPLAQAPDGACYLQDDDATVARGLKVFADNCAACHVSYNKMPKPPAGTLRDTPQWDRWTQSADFKTRMAEAMRAPDFLDDNYLSTDRRYPIGKIGTNACAPLATNALNGHVWDNFSSQTYKNLTSIGTIGIDDPFTGEKRPYKMPGGGRGFERMPSLVSIWASAPYLHNNSVGMFTGDPSVKGRMAAYRDAMEKLLWPDQRRGFGSILRTTQTSWLVVEKSYLPGPLFTALKKRGLGLPGNDDALRIGPIPKDTPVNLIANLDLEFSLGRLADFATLAIELNDALRDIRDNRLGEDASAARLKQVAPALLKLSKCADFVTDRGHLFGSGLSDADKRALIAYVKRL